MLPSPPTAFFQAIAVTPSTESSDESSTISTQSAGQPIAPSPEIRNRTMMVSSANTPDGMLITGADVAVVPFVPELFVTLGKAMCYSVRAKMPDAFQTTVKVPLVTLLLPPK